MHGGFEVQADDNRRRRSQVALVCGVRLYRDALSTALERTGDLALAGSAATVAGLLGTGCAADAFLIDIAGGMGRIEAQRLAMAVSPRPVIGFGVESVDAAVDCVEAGLLGFVPAEGSVADLVTALRAALAGQLVCSPEAARGIARRLAARTLDGPAGGVSGRRVEPALTGREREIAGLVGDGFSNKEIAKRLAISPATVKNHVHIILEKLQVERRARVAPRLRAVGIRP